MPNQSNPQERDRLIPGAESIGRGDAGLEPIEGEFQVADTEDGGAEVVMLRPQGPKRRRHGQNLALVLPESELGIIGRALRDRLEEDRKAREKRDEIYAEGIRRSGLGNDAPGGATFEGASRVVHPMIAEACVDFAAMSLRELYPPDGPAKAQVFGDPTPEKTELGERQSKHMNWQLTDQMEEYASELDQCLTQLGIGGSQFMKFWNDAELGRATCEFVPVDDILLPFAAASFYTSPRISHRMHLTSEDVEDRIESGMYRDVYVSTSSYIEEPTKAAQASEKVEGKERSGQNIDGLAEYYEVNTRWRISADGNKRLPYLITIDDRDQVLSIYRNWDEDDDRQRRLHWIVEWGFIPWRGAYKIGFPHLIGGLSAAATGALRAFLDSAHVNNAPTGVKLKASRVSGQSSTAEPTQIVEIEGPVMVDDIRKLVMPMPFNPPSMALFQLIGWLTDAAKGVVTTAEEKISEASNTMPVGTTLALIEQGQKVMSSIFGRLHRSQRKVFEIVGRLNRDRDIEREQMEALGEVLATRRDYAKALAVQPVSDPNIFTDAQRFAQGQAVMQMATMDPEVRYNKHAAHKRMLKTMRVPQVDEILPDPPEPEPMNVVATDVSIMLGQMQPAFPGQDHLAHLEGRLRLASDPVMQAMFMDRPQTVMALVENIRQHVAFLYSEIAQKAADRAVGGDAGQFADPRMLPMLDRALAAASKVAHAALHQQLEPVMPLLQQLVQRAAQVQPPQPMDPTAVAAQDVQRRAEADKAKAAKDQADSQLKVKDAERKAAKDAADLALRQRAELRKDAAEAHDQSVDEAKLALQTVEAATPGNQIVGI